jgi:hypothetical protein
MEIREVKYQSVGA